MLLAAVGKRRAQLLAQRQAIDEALAELDDITAQTEAALQSPAPRAQPRCQRLNTKERAHDQRGDRRLRPLALPVRQQGRLARVRPDDLAAQVVRALISRTGVKPEDIEDIIVGCAFPEGEQGLNVARLIGLLADLPLSVAGVTVNRFCGSSMQSIHIAAGQIALGAGEVFICAGIESMSRVPMMGYNPLINPALMKSMPGRLYRHGRNGRERRPQVADPAAPSRRRSPCAAIRRPPPPQAAGNFTDEIVPIARQGRHGRPRRLHPRRHHAEGLAGLKPAFDKDGTVTAGTSSPLTDGAAAVLVCSEDYADKHGLSRSPASSRSPSPAARRRSWASARLPRRKKRLPAPGSRSARWTS